MSAITDTIREGLPWNELRDFLVNYPYGQVARAKTSVDPIKRTAEVDAMTFHDEGTWDEVRQARNFGLITNDQYLEVARELAARA